MTVNTKAALAEVEQMFSSPLRGTSSHASSADGDGVDLVGEDTDKFDASTLAGLPTFDDDDDRPGVMGRSETGTGTVTFGLGMSTILERTSDCEASVSLSAKAGFAIFDDSLQVSRSRLRAPPRRALSLSSARRQSPECFSLDARTFEDRKSRLELHGRIFCGHRPS
jgi:hypothetical protein